MSKLRWVEILADMPEPGAHAIVRDRLGVRWVNTGRDVTNRWSSLAADQLDAVDRGHTAPVLLPWQTVVDRGPLQLSLDAAGAGMAVVDLDAAQPEASSSGTSTPCWVVTPDDRAARRGWLVSVTWRELPADAPEPPPLSLVRDPGGLQWLRAYEGPQPWAAVWLGGSRIDAVPPISRMDWRALNDERAPLKLAERDVDEYAPWSAPGDLIVEPVEPSAYEIRQAALDAAVRLVATHSPASTQRALETARDFERYLRGDEQDGDA